jgi:UDP-2-acetamido-2-deoxy-ribo-hexuluronate aminotransferase
MDFIDLKKQYQLIKPSVQKRIENICNRANFIMGNEIAELEEYLARYTGTNYCLTCSSGTDALLLPLMALGIGPGDAVFTTTFTFVATAEVIAHLGATPVFVDIDSKTYNMDPIRLREEILKVKNGESLMPGMPRNLKPKAVLPVDLFGLCADYDEIMAIANEFELFLLEDAAQSFGGMYKGKKACSFGDMAATSFFPAKPLGCYGDGGAVFLSDINLFETLKSLRIHGQGTDKYENVRIGINGRMDTIQAAVLLAKMEIFDKENELRQIIAERYSTALANSFVIPAVPQGLRSAWAQYSILCEKREETMASLKQKGVPTAIYYPKPLHLQKAFAYLGYKTGHFPVAEDVASKILSVPMHPYLEEHEQDIIISALLAT